MSQERRRQKKLEKHRRKRAEVKRAARQRVPLGVDARARRLIHAAAGRPFGPAYVSAGFRDEEFAMLVVVALTRQLPDGRLLPALALVDRTCLGIKNATVLPPCSGQYELERTLQDRCGSAGPMEPCDPLLVQSIVFHAIDYAESLGFKPHREFPAELFGPRPPQLLETPLAHPAQPIYISGPHDNAVQIMQQLRARVGENFRFLVSNHDLGVFARVVPEQYTSLLADQSGDGDLDMVEAVDVDEDDYDGDEEGGEAQAPGQTS